MASVASCALIASCAAQASDATQAAPVAPSLPEAGAFTEMPAQPEAGATSAFWEWWGDGQAELSSYRVSTPRYGADRNGELVLIYVTEPHDRTTWIKDDNAEAPERVEVLKLNTSLKFLTGIYPYSVMSSVFAPVDAYFDERFAPVKITTSVQEWCGNTFHEVWPGQGRLRSLLLSYFASDGEQLVTRDAQGPTLYEDALLIQLRELDGPFAEGQDWEGSIVPALWQVRRAHRAAEPIPGRITRTEATRNGVPVTRFTIAYGEFTRTIDVEQDLPRRILGWTTSAGEEVELVQTERLAYWGLNGPEDVGERGKLGLDEEGYRVP